MITVFSKTETEEERGGKEKSNKV